jgi:hypothetical protein
VTTCVTTASGAGGVTTRSSRYMVGFGRAGHFAGDMESRFAAGHEIVPGFPVFSRKFVFHNIRVRLFARISSSTKDRRRNLGFGDIHG